MDAGFNQLMEALNQKGHDIPKWYSESVSTVISFAFDWTVKSSLVSSSFSTKLWLERLLGTPRTYLRAGTVNFLVSRLLTSEMALGLH